MTNLYDPPPIYDLPLVKGQDVIIDFRNRVPGSDPAEYQPYDDDVSVALIIDTEPPVEAIAVINADHAVCIVESEISDPIKRGVLWRCRVSLPGSVDLVPMNGVTLRSDGKKT